MEHTPSVSSEQSLEQQENPVKPPSAVFSTYALIELIMLLMTTFDITVAMRVCKYWRKVLKSSKALKVCETSSCVAT